jgi:hypothetical protein
MRIREWFASAAPRLFAFAMLFSFMARPTGSPWTG